MKFVSSDTNVWLDFEAIGRLAWPFRLPYTYIMYEETLAKELLKPSDFSERLIRLGLKVIKLTEDELYFADDVLRKYKRLSKYDRVALAIAKKRNIPLLSGDKPLREAAESEDVEFFGTLRLFDELLEQNLISVKDGLYGFRGLKENDERRLPVKELNKRIEACEKKIKKMCRD